MTIIYFYRYKCEYTQGQLCAHILDLNENNSSNLSTFKRQTEASQINKVALSIVFTFQRLFTKKGLVKIKKSIKCTCTLY